MTRSELERWPPVDALPLSMNSRLSEFDVEIEHAGTPPPQAECRFDDEQPAGLEGEAASLVRLAFAMTAQAAGSHPVRLFVLMRRMAGLPYSEIGAELGVSKQAVHKHVAAICRQNPALAPILRRPGGIVSALAGFDTATVELRTQDQNRFREATAWMQRPN